MYVYVYIYMFRSATVATKPFGDNEGGAHFFCDYVGVMPIFRLRDLALCLLLIYICTVKKSRHNNHKVMYS